MSTRPSPPLRSLIVGLGSTGLRVHLSALRELRATGRDKLAGLIADSLPMGYDIADVAIRKVQSSRRAAEIDVVGSLARAAELLYPGNTVVHLCIPSHERAAVLADLVDRGFRLVLTGNPVATDPDSLHRLLTLVTRYQLRCAVLAPWLSSGVARRLLAAAGEARFGAVRHIEVRHCVPRLALTMSSPADSTTALDIDVPDSVALALALGGNGELASAAMYDTPRVDGRTVVNMGSAELTIEHSGGAVTEIVSDLAAPMWDHRVSVEFECGSVECHFPLTRANGDIGDMVGSYAQMYWRFDRGDGKREIFTDAAVLRGVWDAYRRFAARTWSEPSLRLHSRVVELMADARALCAQTAVAPSLPEMPRHSQEAEMSARSAGGLRSLSAPSGSLVATRANNSSGGRHAGPDYRGEK